MGKRVNIERETYLKLLIYGTPGSGKTRFAGTAALDERTAPVLWLNISGNPTSLRGYETLPHIIDIEQLADINEPYDFLVRGQPKNHRLVKRFDLTPPYKTIVVDQITDLQRLSFAFVTGSSDIGPGSFPASVHRQHFGQVLSQMTNFAKLYFSLEMHVILTALEKEVTNEVTGAVSYKPLLWGQSHSEVPGYALAECRLCHRNIIDRRLARQTEDITVDTTNVAFFKPGPTFVAKWQYGPNPVMMADPTVKDVVDYMNI